MSAIDHSEPGESAVPTVRPDHRWGRSAVLLVALLVLVLVAVGAWQVTTFVGYGAPVARVGQVLQVEAEIDNRPVEVELPFGTLSFAVGEPRRSSIGDAGDDLVDPPSEGSFLPLQWGLEAEEIAELRPVPRTDAAAEMADVELTLVVAGREFPVSHDGRPTAGVVGEDQALALRDGHPDGSSAMVAVPGAPERYEVRVGYDGEQQTLRVDNGDVTVVEAGRFAAYGDLPESGKVLTAPARLPAGLRAVPAADGQIQIVWQARLPYVAGLGWAEPGTSWVAVSFTSGSLWSIAVREPGLRSVAHWVGVPPERLRLRLGGRRPAVPIIDVESASSALMMLHQSGLQMAIFRVPDDETPGMLRIETTRALFAKLGTPPPQPRIRLRWQVRLAELGR